MFITRERVGATEHDEMVQAVEFPHLAHIRATAQAERHFRIMHHRPAHVGARVAVPVNVPPEMNRLLEDLDTMPANLIC